jgi:lipopolysaccharide transport system ATP-binding protein
MFSIKSMCERVIYLKKGQIVFDGPTADGLKLYEDDSRLQDAPWFKEADEGGRPITFTDVRLLNERGVESNVFNFGERMTIRLRYQTNGRVERPDIRLGFDRDDGTHTMTFSSQADGVDLPWLEGEGEIEVRTPPIKLVSDLYVCNVVVRDPAAHMIAAQIGGHFHVRHPVFAANAFGVFHEAGEWRVRADVEERLSEVSNGVG